MFSDYKGKYVIELTERYFYPNMIKSSFKYVSKFFDEILLKEEYKSFYD